MLDNATALWYNNILTGNLAQPNWVLSNASFEPFEAPDVSSANRYLAITSAFLPSMECEEGRLDGQTQVINNATHSARMTFTSDSCSAEVVLPLVDPAQASQRKNQWEEKNYMGSVQSVSCDAGRQSLAVVTMVNTNVTRIQLR